MANPLPECPLAPLGLAWRWCQDTDLRIVAFSWSSSFEPHFISGTGTSPLDGRHGQTVAQQRRRLADDPRAERLLKRLYRSDMAQAMAALVGSWSDPEAPRALVVYDVDNPELVIAWGIADDQGVIGYVYVKQNYRRQGVGSALLQALAPAGEHVPKTTFMTPAGLALVQAQPR